MTDRYAVLGNPIAHSKSPEIHTAFALEVGHDIAYTRILVPLDGFVATIDAYRKQGACGVNVTVPFKIEAYQYGMEHSQRAEVAGAANTLRFDPGQSNACIFADNTDGVGLVSDIRDNLGYAIVGKRVLLLGAGGAARSVMGALLDELPASISLTNRTIVRAHELAERFIRIQSNAQIEVVDIAHLTKYQYDIIINATSASLHESLPVIPATAFAEKSLAYDMMYGKGATPFLRFAANAGAATTDGLGMLVEQAAEAFLLWRGVRPQTAPIIAGIRQSANNNSE
ncbi:MAG: shikimate dehydrogenase [Pseudomonadota bacterium]